MALQLLWVWQCMLCRQRLKGPHAKAHAAIAIGLSLWLCANIVWAIYEIVLDIVPPVPSLADVFWLSAYGFFAYHLLSVYKEHHKKFNRSVLVASIIGSALLLGYLITFTANVSVLNTTRGIVMFSVIIAYPILNSVLTVLAIVILIGFRNERFWSVSWIFESLAMLCIVVADSWFALVVLTGLVERTLDISTFPSCPLSCYISWFAVVYRISHFGTEERYFKTGKGGTKNHHHRHHHHHRCHYLRLLYLSGLKQLAAMVVKEEFF